MLLRDISFTDMLSGGVYHPDDLTRIRMPEVDSNFETVVIVHITDDGTYEYIQCDIDNGYIVFDASSFSIYGIAGFMGTWDDVLSQPGTNGTLIWIWIVGGICAIGGILILFVNRRNCLKKVE